MSKQVIKLANGSTIEFSGCSEEKFTGSEIIPMYFEKCIITEQVCLKAKG
jgi:hypothetical protein